MSVRMQYRRDPADATEKRCPKCSSTKPVEEFHRNRAAADGRQAYCKSCVKGRYDPEYAEEYQRRRLADPARRATHRRATRRGHLERRYGITPERYDELLVEQAGRCALCPAQVTAHAWLPVDHCHATGRVRGLLCMKCNIALERVDASLGWLERARQYLTLTQTLEVK